jgi:hypothetical protein
MDTLDPPETGHAARSRLWNRTHDLRITSEIECAGPEDDSLSAKRELVTATSGTSGTL